MILPTETLEVSSSIELQALTFRNSDIDFDVRKKLLHPHMYNISYPFKAQEEYYQNVWARIWNSSVEIFSSKSYRGSLSQMAQAYSTTIYLKKIFNIIEEAQKDGR